MKLPDKFEEKMQALLGDEFPEYLSCYEEPRYYGLRVNTNKISVEDFKKFGPFEITPIPVDRKWVLLRWRQGNTIQTPILFCWIVLPSGTKCHDTCQSSAG